MSKAKQAAMIVALLREFCRREAEAHRDNPPAAWPKLRMLNALARDILAASRKTRRRRSHVALVS
jgi:hypothetical protein